MDADSILALEHIAFKSWPAAENEPLDGWCLRATEGITRRANSVFASGPTGDLALDERIRKAEAFYEARGLPCRFQITPASRPPELDQELERGGYTIEAPVSIQTADARAVATFASDDRVRVESALSDAWFDVSGRHGRFRTRPEPYRALLERLGERARFAVGATNGVVLAVGLGVVDGDWFGIFSMLTLERSRRQGLARGVLVALARAAIASGASQLYLQVERENPAALALYRELGFIERYGYHYRLLSAPRTPPSSPGSTYVRVIRDADV